jgi:hypothetical protein
LRGAEHTHRNIGFAQQQVLDRVGGDELDSDGRELPPDIAQQRGQDVMADDGARGDPHRALELAGRSLGHERGFSQRLLG